MLRQSIAYCTVFCALAAPNAAWCADDSVMFRHSGLPMPRFASLKSNEVNIRVGPGRHYPIAWTYKRAGYPLEIVEEFGHWRKVRDIEKTAGWVHKNLLSSNRTVLILGEDNNHRPLYLSPDANSAHALEAEPHAQANLDECTPQWCKVTFKQQYTGWIRREYLWGVYPEEVISR